MVNKNVVYDDYVMCINDYVKPSGGIVIQFCSK